MRWEDEVIDDYYPLSILLFAGVVGAEINVATIVVLYRKNKYPTIPIENLGLDTELP